MRPGGRFFYLTSLLYRFWGHLSEIGELQHPAGDVHSMKEFYVQKAMDFIERNYSYSISIAEIARHIGIDRKYLSALFRDVVHFSPQYYLMNYRMTKACVLLENEGLSVKEIAQSVGYDDPFLFSKMFKKLRGMPPKSYRERKIRESTRTAPDCPSEKEAKPPEAR